MSASILSSARTGFRIDPSRGERSARVSSEWFSRPDDERYLSLTTDRWLAIALDGGNPDTGGQGDDLA